MSNIRQLYMDIRSKYLRQIRDYEKQGWRIDEKFRVKIPKRVKAGSIRKIEKLKSQLKESIHEQKVETGYFTRLRRQRKKQTANRLKGKTTRTFLPPTVPKVSDAILRQVESEITIAGSFIARSKPYQEAVRETADELSKATVTSNGFGTYEYFVNQLKENLSTYDSRVKLSEIIEQNWNEHFQRLENYLYDFQSDGAGALIHETQALSLFASIMRDIGQTVTNEQYQSILEDINDNEEGFISNNISEDYTE